MSDGSTTPDLVELSRRFVEAANRRDFDAVMSFYAPDAVLESVGLGTSFDGLTAIRSFWEDMFVAYEEFALQPQETIDLGNGVIFVVDRTSTRLGSTARFETCYAIVSVWEEGSIVRMTTYKDTHQARAAAERLAEELR
jgi:ketosteroid isomerase-like protein